MKRALAIFSAMGALSIGLNAQAPLGPPGTVEPPPLARAYQCNIVPSTAASPGGGLKGKVEINTIRKRIKLTWGFEIAGHGHGFDAQTIDVNFWPTAATFTRDKLVVGGKTIKNKTKIQVFEFVYPSLPSSHEVQYAALIASTYTVYNARQIGQIGILRMWDNKGWGGAAGAIFVQFRDSHDVQLLNLQTNEFSMAIPASAQPLLTSSRYSTVTSIGHPQEGLLYLFSPVPNGLHEELLLLVDSNTDGILDEHYSPTGAEWAALIGDASILTLYD